MTTHTYDDADQLTDLTTAKNGTTLDSHQYTHDNNGNITQWVQNGVTHTYTVDNVDRVTSAASPTETESYTFDAVGNILTKVVTGPNAQTVGYSHNAADRVTTVTVNGTPHMVTYDNNGNMLTNGFGNIYQWNSLDQLINVNSGQHTFAYDPLDNRHRVNSINLLYDDLDLIVKGTTHLLHGQGIDDPLELRTTSKTLSYVKDHLGSTRKLLNVSGQVASTYHYSLYGQQTSLTPDADNPFTYTGRELVANNLYYYRARYYDANLERFISDDPLGDAQRYVGGNPLIYRDPLGLLVEATFYKATGILHVRDVDTGREAVTSASSGKSNDPIPSGKYKIWEGPKNVPDTWNYFRLEPVDSNFGDSFYGNTGRYGFELHKLGRGINYGCISASDNEVWWPQVRDLIRATKTRNAVDKLNVRQPLRGVVIPWFPSNMPIKEYGTLTVW